MTLRLAELSRPRDRLLPSRLIRHIILAAINLPTLFILLSKEAYIAHGCTRVRLRERAGAPFSKKHEANVSKRENGTNNGKARKLFVCRPRSPVELVNPSFERKETDDAKKSSSNRFLN